MKSNRILLKATEFYKISLNSLQILMQISLWMSILEITADFITDFTAVFIIDFTANFMLNPQNFIIDFMANFTTSTRISLKSTRIHEIHSISLKSAVFHVGFHSNGRSADFTAVFIMDFTANFMLNPPDFMKISLYIPGFHWHQQDFMKSTAFHWNQQYFIMDFTVDSIPVKYVMKFIMKSGNEINGKIHNEILLKSVKSVQFNEVLWNPVDFIKSCEIPWIY